MKEERDFLLLLLSFLDIKFCFLLGSGGVGVRWNVCAERDVMQEGSQERT